MFGEFTLFKRLVEQVWRMNRSAKGLLIVTTILDGFSLANHRQFAKFAKLCLLLDYIRIVTVISFVSIIIVKLLLQGFVLTMYVCIHMESYIFKAYTNISM